jgi:hypothetical protein
MQSAKDSFYIALRDRLAALNPQRTVFLNGVTRPAVVVVENECITAAGPLPEAFYLGWGTAQPAAATLNGQPPLLALACTISYWTGGSAEMQGVDRGRVLAQLDFELLSICSPLSTPQCDYSQTPPANLGTNVLWTLPDLRLKTQPQLLAAAPQWAVMGDQLVAGPPDSVPVIRLERAATLTVYFYPEAIGS